MDFNISESQEMLRDMARDFLTKECPKSRVRQLYQDECGYDHQMWGKMAELGWQGLVLPEEYGGSAADFLDMAILMEEMGRNILPGPFFSTIAFGALPVLQFGTDKQKKKYLPGIADGASIWTMAFFEESAGYRPADIKIKAKRTSSGYLIQGEKIFVPDVHIADYLLVAARTHSTKDPSNGITMFIVDASDSLLEKELIPTMAGDRQYKVTFDKVQVSDSNVLGAVDKGWEVIDFLLQRAAVLKCAEISGACQAVLSMTNAYAKERIQFDRPIGAFQAVQHKLADMQINTEGLQYLLYQAAWEISNGLTSPLHISMAKVKAAKVYESICADGITTHGALGFTMDCDIGLYYRRVRAAEFAGGNTELHKENIAFRLGI